MLPVHCQKRNAITLSANQRVWQSHGHAKKWVHFLHGSKHGTIVATDHSCLRNLTSSKVFENRRLNRYAVELSEYNLNIMFRTEQDAPFARSTEHYLPVLLREMRMRAEKPANNARSGDEHDAPL
jgi:hypothetical protein